MIGKVRSSYSIRKYLTVAAVLISFALLALYVYKSFYPIAKQQQLTSIYGDDVAPGGKKAIITLSDGTIIELLEDQQQVIVTGTAFNVNAHGDNKSMQIMSTSIL